MENCVEEKIGYLLCLFGIKEIRSSGQLDGNIS